MAHKNGQARVRAGAARSEADERCTERVLLRAERRSLATRAILLSCAAHASRVCD